MATVIQKEATRVGAGSVARTRVVKALTLTMAAGVTVSGSITVPEGSWLGSIRAEVATAFTGSPTNINLRAGSAAAGQQVVADVDIKAAGHFLATIVAAFDSITGLTTYHFQIAINGGTDPAGTAVVLLSYYPPTP